MACTFLLASAPPAPGPTRTATILQVLRRSSLLLAGVLALASLAGGQAVVPSATYVREHWTVADGLPINTITSLVQTRDGYLWLGTNDGVVRFDGVRFTVYNAGNTPEIPSNRIVSLHEDRAGALCPTTRRFLKPPTRGVWRRSWRSAWRIRGARLLDVVAALIGERAPAD